MFFKKKEEPVKAYDRERLTPVIRCSICSGEQVACFQDKVTGRLTEVMLIVTDADLEQFRRKYGITEEIKRVY